MFNYLALIEYVTIGSNDEITSLSEEMIAMNILKKKNFDDCIHVASGIISACDYIVSWNFKHLVNINTINGVRAITLLKHYKSIDIIQPTLLIQEREV